MAREERDPRDEIPEEVLEAVRMERTVHPEESDADLARRLIRESAGRAAATVAYLAEHGENSRIRFDASKYILERVLGPAGQDVGVNDPLRGFLEDLYTRAESHANGG